MNNHPEDDTLRLEYDLSDGVRGKHYRAYRQGTTVVFSPTNQTQDASSSYGEGTAGAALGAIMRQARSAGERSDKFACLTLSLLETEPDLDIAQAWLWSNWPGRPKGRSAHDLSVDIVAKANDGRLIAVQCRCQNDGTSLAKGSINSFVEEASAHHIFDELWLISNVRLSRNAIAVISGLATPCKHILFQSYSNTSLEVGSVAES